MGRVKKFFRLFLAMLVFTCSIIELLPVQAASGDKIILNYKNAVMRAGNTLDLNIALGSGVKTSKKVTWKSSNKKVLSVNKK